MPGFLSAIFAAPDDRSTATSADHAAIDDAVALDPALHIHATEGETNYHSDGAQTDWAASQDIDVHLDLHAVTQFGFEDQHGGDSG